MDIATALIACTTAALGTCKALFDIVQTINDSPRMGERLTITIDLIQSILHDIHKAVLAGAASDEDSGAYLKRSIDSCRMDMSIARLKLEKLLVLPDDSRTAKTWKSIRVVIQKEQMRELDEYLHRHVSHLYMKLALMQQKGSY
jgi:hypothetical protein